MGQDGRCHPSEQAPEGLGAMPCQSQPLGQFPDRGFDAIPQHRHRPPDGGGQKPALGPAGRQDDRETVHRTVSPVRSARRKP